MANPAPEDQSPQLSRRTGSPPRWVLAMLLAAVFVFRLMSVAVLSPALAGDVDMYREIARHLAFDGSFALTHEPGLTVQPTAYRPPLYPLMLAAFERLPDDRWAIGLLHVVLGTATVWGVWRLAAWWKLSPAAGLMAAALVAVDPLLVNLASLVMTETLAAFLTVFAMLALARASRQCSPSLLAWAGLLLGLAALCRPVFLVWLLLVSGAVFLVLDAHRVRCVTALVLTALVVIAPWVVRNVRTFGQPIVATTHGGYTAFEANHPTLFEHLRSGAWGELWNPDTFFAEWAREKVYVETPDGRQLDELASDRRAYELAWQNIRQQPAMFACAAFWREAALFGVLPHQIDPAESSARRWLRYAIAVGYSIELVLAAIGMWCVRKQLLCSPWIWAMLLIVSFAAAHTVFWADMRIRTPLVSVVALLAAQGMTVLAGKSREPSPLLDAT